jgi:hypothetical protein
MNKTIWTILAVVGALGLAGAFAFSYSGPGWSLSCTGSVAPQAPDAVSAPANPEVVEPLPEGTPTPESLPAGQPDAQAAPVSVLSRVGSGALAVLGAILSPVGCGGAYASVQGSGEVGFRKPDGSKIRGQGCVVAEIGDRDLSGGFDTLRWYATLYCANGPKLERGDPALKSRCPEMPPSDACELVPVPR